VANSHTKLEVSSCSLCGDITWGVKFYNGSPDPDYVPFREDFVSGRLGLAMVSQCTKFEVSRFTRYEAMNGGAKCRKWGGVGGQESFKVTMARWQCHHSIERTRLPIRL